MDTRQSHSIDDIKNMLLARVDEVAHHYAPSAKGSHTHFGKYFTLNPGRADRSVGSFYIHVSGANAGKWCDHAVSNGFGDILDLIALACHCDMAGALKEARAFLGLHTLSPADLAERTKSAEQAKRRRAELQAQDQEKAKKRGAQALALFLSGQERIKGTPVEAYLRDQRGIDLSLLGRQPRSIRFHPECFYQFVDQESGEVIQRKLPAMLALINNKNGEAVAVHRTYLGRNDDGVWDKASLPCRQPKKVLGFYAGAWINLWTGTGPRGGKGGSLTADDRPKHVFVSEGIEDALSGVCLLPDRRFISAISLSNMGALDLPDCVQSVTLIADQDENETAREQLDLAIRKHQSAGRKVYLFQNQWGGKDLNDALRDVVLTQPIAENS